VPDPASLLGHLVRYGLVGVLNTAVGLAVILGVEFGLHGPPLLANAAGYAAGFALGFVLNRSFVFRSDTRVSAAGPRYLIAVAASYAANLIVLQGMRSVLPAGDLVRAASQLCAMGSYTVLLFVLSRYWVFAGAGGGDDGSTIR
jgi:putative flippase GtrA